MEDSIVGLEHGDLLLDFHLDLFMCVQVVTYFRCIVEVHFTDLVIERKNVYV